jgi:hypothetical protein
MSTRVSVDKVLGDASGIEKVWKENPTVQLGKDGANVTLDTYQASIKAVTDLTGEIDDARHNLEGLLDRRDDAAALLNSYNTRALSAIRGIFGPDSPEYDQAGGVRTSERKVPARKTIVAAK